VLDIDKAKRADSGSSSPKILPLSNSPAKLHTPGDSETMLSILRKARLKDKEMRILMLYELPVKMQVRC
jgi:hypothetical protein